MLMGQGLQYCCCSVMFQTHVDVLNVEGVLIFYYQSWKKQNSRLKIIWFEFKDAIRKKKKRIDSDRHGTNTQYRYNIQTFLNEFLQQNKKYSAVQIYQ